MYRPPCPPPTPVQPPGSKPEDFFQDFLASFREQYPEFVNISDSVIETAYKKAWCLYPSLRYGDCSHLAAAGMVIAHELTINNNPTESGLIGGGGYGLPANATAGDVSIGLQSAPVSSMFQYYFGSTKYGLAYLAWLAQVGGIKYVN